MPQITIQKERKSRLYWLSCNSVYLYKKTGMGVRGKVLERRSDGRNRKPQKFFVICKNLLQFCKTCYKPYIIQT